jgi:RhoGAP domain
MEILFAFLSWTASFSQVDEEGGSKMDSRNLATVITPNILSKQQSKDPETNETFLAIEAVRQMIDINDQLCEVRSL